MKYKFKDQSTWYLIISYIICLSINYFIAGLYYKFRIYSLIPNAPHLIITIFTTGFGIFLPFFLGFYNIIIYIENNGIKVEEHGYILKQLIKPSPKIFHLKWEEIKYVEVLTQAPGRGEKNWFIIESTNRKRIKIFLLWGNFDKLRYFILELAKKVEVRNNSKFHINELF